MKISPEDSKQIPQAEDLLRLLSKKAAEMKLALVEHLESLYQAEDGDVFSFVERRQAGRELDRAVAEAVDPHCSVGMCASSGCIDIPATQSGDTAATDRDVLAVWKWDGERNWRTLPEFSTDLNAAFAAAEIVVAQVWDEDQRDWELSPYIGSDERGWTCSLGCDEDRVFEATPALAICAAILKLKAVKP